jgi:hypothetical protein
MGKAGTAADGGPLIPPPLEVRVSFRDTPAMPRRFSLFVIALCLAAFTSLAQEPAITPKHSRHYALSGSSAGIASRSFLIQL